MVALPCPACQDIDSVVPFSRNRSGTQRYRCKACGKTFTPQGRTRKLSEQKRQTIEGALAERISQRGIARALKVSRNTIRAVRKKGQNGL
jgi:transposase-like protein